MGIRYDNTVYGLSAGAGEHAVMAIGHAAGWFIRWRGKHNERNNAQGFLVRFIPLARGTPNGSDVRRLRYRFIRWRGGTLQLDARMNLLTRFIPLARGTRAE
ncbi:hypothetical protein LNP74_05815 [Klebsiella pneumoniae subsp. pneumoniae]|nr:hypothetical protein [Klebsiella pneumoniae subsp. pneumoniae]